MNTIYFFGTHEFAAAILEAVIKSGFFNIAGVVTMPDKPAGRHQEIQKSAVKIVAEKYGLKIDQPETLKNWKHPVSNFQCNLVVDYGKIIPNSIINLPPLGTINIHPSLLPKYRGASPIQTALINGESQTGITIMKIDTEMDHGPIIIQKIVKIEPKDTYKELYARLAIEAGALLIQTLPDYLNGKIQPVEQDHKQATFTKMLIREDGKIDFAKSASEIFNLYRGLTPWPGIFSLWNGRRLKLLKIQKNNKDITAGKVVVENKKIFIGCGNGSITVQELQLEGKKTTLAEIFLNGYPNFNGSQLS